MLYLSEGDNSDIGVSFSFVFINVNSITVGYPKKDSNCQIREKITNIFVDFTYVSVINQVFFVCSVETIKPILRLLHFHTHRQTTLHPPI